MTQRIVEPMFIAGWGKNRGAKGGWYCIRGNHWLCADPRQALAEFDVLEWIER